MHKDKKLCPDLKHVVNIDKYTNLITCGEYLYWSFYIIIGPALYRIVVCLYMQKHHIFENIF